MSSSQVGRLNSLDASGMNVLTLPSDTHVGQPFTYHIFWEQVDPPKTQTCSCDKFAWNTLLATTAAISRRPFSTSLCSDSLVDVKKETTAKKTKTPHDVPVRQWISAREGKIEITVCLLASNNFKCRRHGWVVEFVISNGHFNQTSRILWLIKNSRPNSSNGLTRSSSKFAPCRTVES